MDQENNNITEENIEPVAEETSSLADNEFSQNIIEELKNSKAEITSLKEQLLRMAAEMENLRKRTEKQIEDSSKYAVTQFVKDLIDVAENFKRALNAVTQEQLENELVKSLYQGIEMINKDLLNIFNKHKVSILTPQMGDEFDHNAHQAVGNIDHEEVESGNIVQVLQSGYMLNERLLRPAMVIIAN